jgi:DNA modification methylase
MSMVTLWRTKFNILRAAFCNHNAAPNTFISSDSIFHKHSIPQKTAKNNQIYFYKWLLNNYAKPGDKILDTHGGSGSICIACHDLGFDLDLFEIDKDYFEAGKGRLEKHMSQGQIFLPDEQKLIVQNKLI